MPNIEQQIEFFDIACPCIGVCQSGAKGYCKGCLRSREERQYWFKLDNHTKHKISQACYQRKQALARKQQKQARNEEQLSFDKDLEQSLEPTQKEFEFDLLSDLENAPENSTNKCSKNDMISINKTTKPLKKKDKKGQIDLF
jgi:uncharacterized protein